MNLDQFIPVQKKLSDARPHFQLQWIGLIAVSKTGSYFHTHNQFRGLKMAILTYTEGILNCLHNN